LKRIISLEIILARSIPKEEASGLERTKKNCFIFTAKFTKRGIEMLE